MHRWQRQASSQHPDIAKLIRDRDIIFGTKQEQWLAL
jgi:hypothetical protein